MLNKALSLVLATLLLVTLVAGQIQAGSEEAPELEDTTGDSTDGHEFRDITKVWVEEEDATQISFMMKMAGNPDAWSPGALIQSGPTYDYEIYFSSMGENYSLVASISFAVNVGGVTNVVQADISLRNVTYDGDDIAAEGGGAGLSGGWDADAEALIMTVPKSSIGDPAVGDSLTHIWAAIWNTDDFPPDQRRDITDAIDSAGSYSNPGNEYVITGGFDYLYQISLYNPGATNQTITANGSAIFYFQTNVTTTNPNGTNVTLTHSSSTSGSNASGWTVTLEPETIDMEHEGDDKVNCTLIITAPEGIGNGSDITVTIIADLTISEGNLTDSLTSNTLSFNVTAEPIPVVVVEPTFIEKLKQWITENIIIVAGVVIVVFILIVVVALVKRKKRGDEFMDELMPYTPPPPPS